MHFFGYFHFYHLFTSGQLKCCHLEVYKRHDKALESQKILVHEVYLLFPKNSKSYVEFTLEDVDLKC